MTKVLATNITSPLGFTTGQNYQAIRAGRSALTPYTSWRGIPEPFAASMFTIEQREKLKMDGFTLFAKIVPKKIGALLVTNGLKQQENMHQLRSLLHSMFIQKKEIIIVLISNK